MFQFTGDSVKGDAERIVRQLRTPLQLRLRFIAQVQTGNRNCRTGNSFIDQVQTVKTESEPSKHVLNSSNIQTKMEIDPSANSLMKQEFK